MRKDPQKYGPKALAPRIAGMEKIGITVGDDPQKDWENCLTELLNTGKRTFGDVAFMLGISQQMIQHDVFVLRIKRATGLKKWNRNGGRPGGPIMAYCRKTGISYSTIYSRMQKAMTDGYSREDAMQFAMRLKIAEPKKKRVTPDPATMTKQERKRYLIREAKKKGLWQSTPRTKKEKKIRTAEPDYFNPELTTLLP